MNLELSQGQIVPIKIRFVRTIASFDSNANNPSVQFMSKVHYIGKQSDL